MITKNKDGYLVNGQFIDNATARDLLYFIEKEHFEKNVISELNKQYGNGVSDKISKELLFKIVERVQNDMSERIDDYYIDEVFEDFDSKIKEELNMKHNMILYNGYDYGETLNDNLCINEENYCHLFSLVKELYDEDFFTTEQDDNGNKLVELHIPIIDKIANENKGQILHSGNEFHIGKKFNAKRITNAILNDTFEDWYECCEDILETMEAYYEIINRNEDAKLCKAIIDLGYAIAQAEDVFFRYKDKKCELNESDEYKELVAESKRIKQILNNIHQKSNQNTTHQNSFEEEADFDDI